MKAEFPNLRHLHAFMEVSDAGGISAASDRVHLSQAAVEITRGMMVPLDVPLPGSSRPIGLTTRAGWMPTPAQARFLDLIRAAARGTTAPG